MQSAGRSQSAVSTTPRRDFLKTVSAASAASMWMPSALSAGAFAAGDETLKVALVGCGNRGSGAAVQALRTEGPVVLWAMADAFQDRLESSLSVLSSGAAVSQGSAKGLQDRINVPTERQFVGLDAWKGAIDCGVDVVILAQPPGFRPQHFEYAVEAGKHVFMEKPLASDAHGVRRILTANEAAQAKNLKVGVGLQRHHAEHYRQCIDALHRGAIGDPLVLRCYWETGYPAKTPFPRDGLTELEFQVRNWYFFDWLSGDHICEQHIHNLDVCNWIMQAHPVEAHGSGGRQVRTGPEFGNIFDHHSVEYTYADGTKMFSSCRQIPGCRKQVAEAAHGTSGTAELDNRTATILRADGTRQRFGRQRGRKAYSPYQVEFDVLFDAIRNDKPHNEVEYGTHSTMTAILGRLATYSGKAIKWDDAFHSDQRLTLDAAAWDESPLEQPDSQGLYRIPTPGVTQVV